MLTPTTNSLTCWPKVIFTRDEWNHLLRLSDIINFKSMFSCSRFLSIFQKPNTMSKRLMQERRHNSGNSQRNSNKGGKWRTKTWRIWKSDHLHVCVQRHWLDYEWKLQSMFAEFSNGQRLRKEISVGTLVFSRVLAKKKNETERTITNMKDSGIALQMSWSPISKTAGIQFFRASSALIRRFFTKEGGKCTIPFSGDTSSAEPVADWWMNWLSRFLVGHFSSM